MVEEVYIIGDTAYAGHTTVHPLAICTVIVLGISVLFLPRRWSVFPILFMTCFISSAQRIVIAGMDFDFLRIMVLFGVMRLLLRKEYIGFVWKSLDSMVALWVASSVFFFILREGTFGAVINRLGFAFDVFGMYFLFRCLIRSWIDIDRIILSVILISIPVMIFFLLEHGSGRNLFSIFGGVPEITEIRGERLRCQGAFSHPILAGCFWALLMPLIAAYWWKSARDRMIAVIGIIASCIVVICSASSTPVMGVLSAVIGGCFFFLRKYMRFVCMGVILTLIALHLVMNGPVWGLIARIHSVGGSTGWHRYNLINQAIININDWWFSGCSGYTVASWGIHAGDVTNQYVLEGVKGGLITMVLFIAVILTAFRDVGRLCRFQSNHTYQLALSWALGVILFVHCSNFIGVSYFGQIWILWYLLLGMIGSMSCKKVKNIRSKITYSKLVNRSY